MIIIHNISAMNAARMFNITNSRFYKATERLSSGYRINRAADDAAGLCISEKMRRQIRGLTQASANAQDGISLVQTAEGTLNEIHEMIQRCNELAIKGANGTLSDSDRAMISDEAERLKSAIDNAASNSVFNEERLFPSDGCLPEILQKNTNISAQTSGSALVTKHYSLDIELTDGNVAVKGITDPAQTASAGAAGKSSGGILADKIATELIPNSINQILKTFPSLKTAMGSNKIQMTLDVSYLDGPSNTLAFAQCSIWSDGHTSDFLVKVDTADFTDADALGTGPNAEMLESTLAHELTHSVMQFTMTKQMGGSFSGVEEFPLWFKEGTAQLSGGGFTTGWNDALHYIVNTYPDQASRDTAISNYLKTDTVANRPYGHGYLACGYIGYLAAKKAGVATGMDSKTIAAGMDRVFSDILGGKNFSQAVQDCTGCTVSNIESAINNASSSLPAGAPSGALSALDFVRELSAASLGGAGSVITSNLKVGGTDILNDTALDTQPFYVVETIGGTGKRTSAVPQRQRTLSLQLGNEAGTVLHVSLFKVDCTTIGLRDTNFLTMEGCKEAIAHCDTALRYISGIRSYYGAIQNRLEHTINNLDNVVENTTASESRIRDTDMAQEMIAYSNLSILRQVGQSFISQANQQSSSVLSLLQ